ncbi:N-formylglutamate amidohydrolase [Mesorhizobium sp. BAC0120]|uniref:N-formylglutamate amidohydrolase n=1 Tax=Mesorhizobium sp. BAC0120 TaxID=3090670 RepID=UPI00298C914D|nr:N-formylglutamate amidohydrolase [Mesorhizobium sp. BAC0120]MDW6025023.1 N-formylglutamate amidohydrolase [Mesorhizobium sp. BAC0120]
MDAARLARLAPSNAAKVTNPHGSSPFVVVCDHASNSLPEEYGTLGLEPAELSRHIAWDPGALPVAQRISAMLDAPLVESCVSRLLIDCNRPLDAPDLIPEISENTEIPGNRNLGAAERARRIALAHQPFHDLIDDVISERQRSGSPTWLVSVHSYTPIYKSVSRPWQVGIIHDDDTRLATPMIEALQRTGVVIGINQPYSPSDRVYYTLERHARSRGLPCAMIEIRNDEISGQKGHSIWGSRLGEILAGLAGSAEYKEAGSAGILRRS